MTTIGVDAPGSVDAWDEEGRYVPPPAAVKPPKRGFVPPWRNPWRRPYVLATLTWVYILWSLVPVLIAIQFSFNDSRSRSSWNGFTTEWYCCGTEGSIAEGASVFGAGANGALLTALQNSLTLGVVTTLIAVPIGTALALGLTRWRSRTSKCRQRRLALPARHPRAGPRFGPVPGDHHPLHADRAGTQRADARAT